jgi:hypothetical protein
MPIPPAISHAGRRLGLVAASSLALLTLGACGDSSGTDDGGLPAAMEIVDGDDQEGTVGEELDDALVVQVTDDRDRPVRNQLVNWRVTAGGGSVFAGSALTDGEGIARERWTLGTVAAAPQSVEARAVDSETGQGIVFATFSATGKAGPVASLAAVTTGTQEGTAGAALATLIVARASDRYGNPVAGVTVTWEASGGGSTSPASSTTDAAGEARTTWTLGGAAGAQQLTARTGALAPASFTAMARAGGATRLEIVSGDGHDGTVGVPLGEGLVVRALDALGNTVPDVPITWSVRSGGGSLSNESAATNSAGVAQATWTLGTTAGTQTVAASAAGVQDVIFTATARSAAPARMEIVSGSDQRAQVNSTLERPLAFRMYDQYGNPVAGAGFIWNLSPEDAGRVTPARSVTDDAGEGIGQWTLGARSGQVNAAPSLEVGQMNYQSFAAYAVPVTATRLELVSGGGQQGAVGAALANPLVTQALDSYGTPVPGVTIGFTASHGGSFAAVSVTTNEQGQASSRWTLGTTLGSQVATASIGTSATLTIGATATTGPPATVEILGGDGQEGPVGEVLLQPLTVRVRDQYGNPVRTSVAWSVSQGTGTLDPQASSTDEDGVATTRWMVGTLGDGNRATAGAGTVTATFRATGLAGGRAWLQDAGLSWQGGPPGGTAGTVYSVYAARVRLFGADGAPVANAAVTWTVTGGGSASPASSTTDGSGYATTSWRLGTVLGENTLSARAGDADPLTFRITTTAGPMCSADVRFEDGSTTASGPVGGLTDKALYAFSKDQFGNPTGGYGASPYPYPTNLGYSIEGTLLTDATGRSRPAYVRVSAVPSTQEFLYSGYLCQGTSLGLLTPRLQTYSLRAGAYPGPAVRIEIGSGNDQIGAAGSTLPQSLAVRLYDSYGNRTEDGVASWQVIAGGGSVAPQSGGLSALWTLGSSTGEQQVRASLANGTSVLFTATATTP